MISNRVYMYCCEDLSLIENYDKAINDNVEIWRCHHRLEIQDNGKIIYTSKQLEEMNLYYNRPASELIFMTLKEHNKLHGKYVPEEVKRKRVNSMRGKSPSAEHRLHLSQALKGRKMSDKEKERHQKHWENQRGKRLSEEIKQKISETHKVIVTDEFRKRISERFKGVPKSEETKKKMSESAKKNMASLEVREQRSVQIKNSKSYQEAMAKRKGEKFWNNGVICVRSIECPEGFVFGKLPFSNEHRENISKVTKGRKFWNNGVINVKVLECPGEGWFPGRTEEYRKKLSESRKGRAPTKGSTGMHWYNNGVDNVLTYECPEGFNSGRLKR